MIPLPVATLGKAKIAAWMHCAGYSDLAISRGLNVSERTVSQYLSDVQRGER